MGRVVAMLKRAGLRNGVRGTNGAWLGVWVGISLAQFLRKRLGADKPVIERLVLQPGQIIEIRDTSVPWGKAPGSPPK